MQCTYTELVEGDCIMNAEVQFREMWIHQFESV